MRLRPSSPLHSAPSNHIIKASFVSAAGGRVKGQRTTMAGIIGRMATDLRERPLRENQIRNSMIDGMSTTCNAKTSRTQLDTRTKSKVKSKLCGISYHCFAFFYPSEPFFSAFALNDPFWSPPSSAFAQRKDSSNRHSRQVSFSTALLPSNQ